MGSPGSAISAQSSEVVPGPGAVAAGDGGGSEGGAPGLGVWGAGVDGGGTGTPAGVLRELHADVKAASQTTNPTAANVRLGTVTISPMIAVIR